MDVIQLKHSHSHLKSIRDEFTRSKDWQVLTPQSSSRSTHRSTRRIVTTILYVVGVRLASFTNAVVLPCVAPRFFDAGRVIDPESTSDKAKIGNDAEEYLS